ncbi:MAG: hypothetical protein KBC11_00200 [Candidatus Pacebacteria bacterium]|nr:hypothetical protein [Candidatus Paceibacterota bacterium]
MEFTFSIRGTLREAWVLFKKHFWFFIALSGVSVVINLIGAIKHIPRGLSLILTIASFIWSIVVIKFVLAAADKKEDKFSLNHIKEMLPTWQQALGMIGVGLLSLLLVVAGLVLLIIPGIWVAFRLSLANFAFIDKGGDVRKAVRTSWDMTKGNIFWTTVLVALVAGGLYIVGFIFFGVGILITYPLAMILMAKFYRALTVHHGLHSHTEVVVQPAEILAPEPEAPKEEPAQAEESHHESDTQNQ